MEHRLKKKSLSYVLMLIALLTACTSPKSVTVQVPEPDYWPTTGWQTSTPESQGMDSALLAQMLEQINTKETSIHSVLVIRNGYLVTDAYFHPYTRDTKMHVQSVTKSVIGMLVGRAIGNGLIKNGEETLLSFYPNRVFENPSPEKNSIQLKHLLSMSSGLDCQEFSGGPSMEQTQDWVQFMLNRPMLQKPGKVFGYCNGNAHLLSSILEKSAGVSARDYANKALFEPLGIPAVMESEWGADPQKITTGGYGLHLRPIDLAKLAFLYLHQGQWEDQVLVPPQWVIESTTEHIQKEDGSGYGYLWTVYPKADHYDALGLGGQQVHVYPSKNLIVIVTASLESVAEAPEIESMLNDYILAAIQADGALTENAANYLRLQKATTVAANPIQPVARLPETALKIPHRVYKFAENPLGWQTLEVNFEHGADVAEVVLNGVPAQVGLDNIYRSSELVPGNKILLRGRWEAEDTFVLDYPYPLTGSTRLGELGESEFRIKFRGDTLQVSAEQLIFAGEPIIFEGST